MPLNFDLQANGWRDDGSEAGVLRASIETGDLVMRPFKGGQFAVDAGTYVFWPGGFGDNADGSGTSLILSTIAPGLQDGVMVRQPFWGNVFGVRWLRDGTAPPFAVMIDGVTYTPPGYKDSILTSEGLTCIDGHALWIVARDLGDGPHHANIILPQRVGVANSLRLFGYVAERRAGYERCTQALQMANVVTLTTSPVGIYSSASGAASPPLFRSARYTNTDTVSRKVTIKNASLVIEQLIIPAGETRAFDPGGPFAMNGNYTHLADAGSVVVGAVYAQW